MIKVYYFGNEYVPQDALAVNVSKKLSADERMKGFEFIHIKDTFTLLDLDIDNSVLLDVALGVSKVTFVNSENLNVKGISTTHDFDLGFFLKMRRKDANIIVIPMNYDENKSIEEVVKILMEIESHSR